jgi:hypothetical protein
MAYKCILVGFYWLHVSLFPIGCMCPCFLLAACDLVSYWLLVSLFPIGCMCPCFLLAACVLVSYWLHVSLFPIGCMSPCFLLAACVLVSYWLHESLFPIGCMCPCFLLAACVLVSYWLSLSCSVDYENVFCTPDTFQAINRSHAWNGNFKIVSWLFSEYCYFFFCTQSYEWSTYMTQELNSSILRKDIVNFSFYPEFYTFQNLLL